MDDERTGTSPAQEPEKDNTADLTGIWQGRITAGGQDLRLVFRIVKREGGWQAVMDSPDQGVNGIPVASIELEGKVLDIDVPAVGGGYRGEITSGGTRIVGSWTQRGSSYSVVLEPVAQVEKVVRPQDPMPPFPYRVEKVRFRNEKKGFTLAGTLTYPEAQGCFPGAVLVSGSGGQNRDEEIFGHRPFLVTADFLARNCFAVLRFDDRGVAESGGDPSKATSEDLAEDARSALLFLRQHPRIDSSAVGLIGHSEGGLIASMIAAEDQAIAFIVLLASPGLPGDQVLARQSRAFLKAGGASDTRIALVDEANRKVYEIAKSAADRKSAAGQMEPILKSLGMSRSEIEIQTEMLLTPWFRFFLGYDPAPTLERVRCPVLALNGSLDLQVAPDENLAAIEAALRAGGNTAVSTCKLQGLNHLFQHAGSGEVQEYARIEETFAPQALELIGSWLIETLEER